MIIRMYLRLLICIGMICMVSSCGLKLMNTKEYLGNDIITNKSLEEREPKVQSSHNWEDNEDELEEKDDEDLSGGGHKVIEQMPRFPGCEHLETKQEKASCAQKKLLQYIYKNLIYPREAKEDEIQGTVVLQFVIRPNGRITDLNILRDIGGFCGEAAAAVIESMDDNGIIWIPGRQDGKKVSVYFTLPIKFKLEG